MRGIVWLLAIPVLVIASLIQPWIFVAFVAVWMAVVIAKLWI